MPVRHTVCEGECLESIAFHYGLFPGTLWDHPENAALRQARDSAVLRPEDVLFVPDLRRQEIACATDATHTFRRRGVPSRFRVQLVELAPDDGSSADRPRANQEYRICFDGRTEVHGETDGEGRIDEAMSPSVRVAEVFIGDEVLRFELGHVGPVEDEASLLARLHGLGYLEDIEGASGVRLQNAVRAFQEDAGLEPTGIADDETRAAVVREYGC